GSLHDLASGVDALPGRRFRVRPGQQRPVAKPRSTDLYLAWCMQFGPRLTHPVAVHRSRSRIIRALQEERRSVEVDECMHVEDACGLDAPHALLADADRLQLFAERERDEGGLSDTRLNLDHMGGRRLGHEGQ